MGDKTGEKIIGILGGMGPEATMDLALKIIRNTPVDREQDHIRMIIDSNPKIESRSEAALSGRTKEVVDPLRETALNLQKAGADFLLIPCNTAHYFIEEIRAVLSVKVLNMIEETAVFISLEYPGVRKAGLLGTDATAKLKIYDRALGGKGVKVMKPAPADQARVMAAILEIKKGGGCRRAGIVLARAAEKLAAGGAEIIIAGCTEIPLALAGGDIAVPLVDPAEILAIKAVSLAKGAPGR